MTNGMILGSKTTFSPMAHSRCLTLRTLSFLLLFNYGRSFSIQPQSIQPQQCFIERLSLSMLDDSTPSPPPKHFTIEQVTTKKRALDVRIFRQFKLSPAEYILQRKKEGSIEGDKELISEEEAINLLMPDYDDRGNYVGYVSSDPFEVYFVAVHNNGCEDLQEGDKYSRQNGVISVVRAQIKNQGGSATLDDCESASSTKNMPHVYLSNLSVDGTQ